MKFKLMLAALIIAPLTLTACAKKEEASQSDTVADVTISAEQQAAIDSVDQPDPDAILVNEAVVAAADAENLAAADEKNGTTPVTEVVTAHEVAAETTTVTQATTQ